MKYWAYINNEILGPYEKEKLFELPVFHESTLICPQTPVGEKTEDWKEASTYPEITAMFGASLAGGKVEQPKPEAGKPQPAAKADPPQPVFNAEIPGNKLKPLSFHSIDPTPPAAAQHINGADFEVNHLGSEKKPQQKEAPQSSTSFTGADFDPMSISNIDRRANTPGLNTPPQESPKPAETEFKAPETPPYAASPAPEAAPAQTPPQEISAAAPEAAPVPDPENLTQAAPADKRFLDEINAKLETLDRNSLTKQDIEPLREKLGKMEEVLSSMKNDQLQREIMDRIQHLEHSLLDIKASLARLPAQAPAPAFNPGRTTDRYQPADTGAVALPTPSGAQTARESSLSPVEPKKAVDTGRQEIVDQGTSRKPPIIAGIVNKTVNFVIILLLLAAVAGVAAFALRQFGVFDVTKHLPFQIPFLSAPQPAETPAPQPLPAEVQAPQGTPQVPAPQAEPAKKDLSPEIIFFGRTYSVKAGGATLENKIYEDAGTRKGDFNKTAWQAKELPNGMFELSAVIPAVDGVNRLIYSYEVDYAKKTVRSLDDASAKPLDAIMKKTQPPRQTKTRIKRGRPGADTAGKKQSRPAAKPAGKRGTPQVKEKPAAAASDEYEYVYEDETTGAEE